VPAEPLSSATASGRWEGSVEASVPRTSRGKTVLLFALFVAALALRIVLLATHHGNADSAGFQYAARIGNARLYSGETLFNYSPGWAYVLFGVEGFGRLVDLPFHYVLGLFYLAADIATTLLIGRERGLSGAMLFFLNPVSILASSYYLQFDGLSILCLLAAIVASRLSRRAMLFWSTVFLSLSLLIKHITWFHPLLFVRQRRLGFTQMLIPLAAYAVFALSFVPYWHFWPGIKAQVLNYRSVSEDYGLAALGLSYETRQTIFVAVLLATVWLLRAVPLQRAALMTFLVVLLFIPGVWEYYFLWPIALGALCGGGVGFAFYTAVVALFMLGSPDGLGLQDRVPQLPGWSSLWFATAFWLLWEVRRLRREGPPAGGRIEETLSRRRSEVAPQTL